MSDLLDTHGELHDPVAPPRPSAPVRVEIDPAGDLRAFVEESGTDRFEDLYEASVAARADDVGAARVRVRALVPCHNRAGDLALLLSDLAKTELTTARGASGPAMSLEVIIADNASIPAIPVPATTSMLRVVRSETNLGGSGGFNLAMRAALKDWERDEAAQDFLWLVDSDARVLPGTLARLVETLMSDATLAGVGPALADPRTRVVHEVGGVIDPRTGRQGPMLTSTVGVPGVETCDYVASCCLLVRRECVERVGLMPDRFINADDAEWCLRIARETGRRIAVNPDAIAMHPRFDRFPTWQRYFGTRNAFGAIDAKGLGRRVRFRHAMSCVAKAINQTLMGRDDLAELHMLGLRDAARGVTTGPASHDVPRPAPTVPISQLRDAIAGLSSGASVAVDSDAAALCEHDETWHELVQLAQSRAGTKQLVGGSRRAGLFGALSRWMLGPAVDVAIVRAAGAVRHWFAADTLVCLSESGAWITKPTRSAAWRALGLLARGAGLAVRIAMRPREDEALPAAPIVRSTRSLTLSIVVLSYNRREALAKTLEKLHEDAATRDAEVIVVDNASTDGSPGLIRERFTHAKLIELESNIAIAGFNRGVEAASGDVVLVLDDDSWPERGVVTRAMELLSARPDLAAATLLPVHPETRMPEWRFASVIEGARSDWPTMGCANLVRRADWLAAGGYDESFFLYRNDTDLALKLLSLGRGVWFDPSWIAWHESPGAATKSARWFRIATRNWVWMCRRHGRGATRLGAVLAGWLWAHKLAGTSLASHAAALRGAMAGVCSSLPPSPEGTRGSADGLRRLIELQRRASGRRSRETEPFGTDACRATR
ncbi:MAG: glycosyltransferase [Phycisphaerales bacterium]|nr:glycosyltransferase [Phycisphaerales bacterium]